MCLHGLLVDQVDAGLEVGRPPQEIEHQLACAVTVFAFGGGNSTRTADPLCVLNASTMIETRANQAIVLGLPLIDRSPGSAWLPDHHVSDLRTKKGRSKFCYCSNQLREGLRRDGESRALQKRTPLRLFLSIVTE